MAHLLLSLSAMRQSLNKMGVLFLLLSLLTCGGVACESGGSPLTAPETNESNTSGGAVTLPSPPFTEIEDGGYNPNGDLCYHVVCAEGTCQDGLCSGGNHPARIAIEPYPLPHFRPGDTVEFEVYSEDEDETDKIFLNLVTAPEGSELKTTLNQFDLVSYHFTWVPSEPGVYTVTFVAQNRQDNEDDGAVLVTLTRDQIIRVDAPLASENISQPSNSQNSVDIQVRLKP